MVEVSMPFGEMKYLMLSLDEKEPGLLKMVANMAPSDLPWHLSWLEGAAQELPVAQGKHPSALLSRPPCQGRAAGSLLHSPLLTPTKRRVKSVFFLVALTCPCVWLSSNGARMLPGKMWGQSSDGVPQEVTVFSYWVGVSDFSCLKIQGRNQEETGVSVPQQGFCCNIGATLKAPIYIYI